MPTKKNIDPNKSAESETLHVGCTAKASRYPSVTRHRTLQSPHLQLFLQLGSLDTIVVGLSPSVGATFTPAPPPPGSQSATMSLREWYAGREVLLTGSTGQLGQNLLDKLLRSLTEDVKVHLIIRPKLALNKDERLYEEIIKTPGYLS